MAVPFRINAKQLDPKHRLELYAVIYFIAGYRRLFPEWPTLIEMPLLRVSAHRDHPFRHRDH